MKSYAIYNSETGEICRVVTCAEGSIEIQMADGEAYIEGKYDDDKFIIENGLPVEKPFVIVPPTSVVLTPAQIRTALTKVVQRRLDSEARTRGYDNIVSACSYAGAPNPFQQESIDFLTWRSGVWVHCYQALADVEAGIRPVPTEEELLAELPQLVFTTN